MRKPFNGDFPLTQAFGVNAKDYARFTVKLPDGSLGPMLGHNGQDYGLPTGTVIQAPHSGQVIEVGFDPTGYGHYIKIENENEGSVLAHLQGSGTVSQGSSVNEGDAIALSDNSGNSTGPHLHWGYYRKPRNRANGYAGFEDQSPYLQPERLLTPLLKIGEEIKLTTKAVPVGDAPGKESFSYGTVDQARPAKVLGTRLYNGVWYYNIDQTYIGGGTGWIKAESVIPDISAPPAPVAPVPPATPVEQPQNQPPQGLPSQHTDAEYNKLLEERNAALSQVGELTAKVNDLNKNYTGFVALGYEKPQDVTAALQKKDDILTGLQTEIQQALDRNIKLTDIIKKKEVEDSTAIDEGLRAAQELNEVKGDTSQVAKELGTKPKLSDILNSIWGLKKSAAKAVQQAKEEAIKVETIIANPPEPTQKRSGLDWLVSLLFEGKVI